MMELVHSTEQTQAVTEIQELEVLDPTDILRSTSRA